jgi:hypothetical protein
LLQQLDGIPIDIANRIVCAAWRLLTCGPPARPAFFTHRQIGHGSLLCFAYVLEGNRRMDSIRLGAAHKEEISCAIWHA